MEPSRRNRALSLALAIVVSTGLHSLYRSKDETSRQMDATRVSDLTKISYKVNGYFEQHSRLPASLDEASIQSRDPRTAQPYVYRLKDERTYELCADFDRGAPNPQFAAGHFWTHSSGIQCVTVSSYKK